MGKKNKKLGDNTIALNRKALHDYFIEERFETGIVLQGWEVKSLRAGRAQLVDSYVRILKNEAWLIGVSITPLLTASTHIEPDTTRFRKLLLHRKEIKKLIGSTEQKGHTLVGLKFYWKGGRVKLEIGLAKGKKQHDKRAAIKAREWNREKSRVLKVR